MSILNIVNTFKTQDDCIAYLEKTRWSNKVVCPYCNSDKTCKHNTEKQKRHQCWNCERSFSVFVGTIFQDTNLPIQKWLLAIALMTEAKKGISALQLSRNLDVTYKTAWSISHKIRKAMKQNSDLLCGIVEMDETYIKVDDKNDNDDDFKGNGRGRGSKDNVAVVGIKEKDGNVKATTTKDVKFSTLIDYAKNNVDSNSTIHTDQFKSYYKFKRHFTHKTVNHAKEFVSFDNTSTNGVEGFWSLLKRGIKGNFHHISLKYLQRYIDEFCFRYNNRKNDNMFSVVVENMIFCK